MEANLNRHQKIKLLKNLQQGRVTLQSLEPPRIYFFYEMEPGVYKMDGKEYTQDEYDAFCEKIKSKNDSSLVWNEGKSYDADNIIAFRLSQGCDPLLD